MSWADRVDADSEQLGNVDDQVSSKVNSQTPTVMIESNISKMKLSIVIRCCMLRFGS